MLKWHFPARPAKCVSHLTKRDFYRKEVAGCEIRATFGTIRANSKTVFRLMSIFSFGKKNKDNQEQTDSSGKKRPIDSFGIDPNGTTVLSKDELAKLGGGRTSSKSRMDDDPYLQNTFSSTIPL